MIPAAVSAPLLAALRDRLKSRRRAERAQIGAAARGGARCRPKLVGRPTLARATLRREMSWVGQLCLSTGPLLPVLKLCPESHSAGGCKCDQPQHVCLIYLYLDK